MSSLVPTFGRGCLQIWVQRQTSDLWQQIISHAAGDELYEQVKDKLQQQSLEKRYEEYKLEEDGLLTYKGRIYIPNVAYLRRVVMDEIHQAPYSGHPRYQKTIATAKKHYFWPGMKKRKLLSIFQGA